jgi:hypothetical protein
LSPILGIIASQNYPRITGSYESIATSTITSGSSNTITFSSIPQTYKHLQIRGIARSSSGVWNYLTFNGDTTQANYYAHELAGNGSAAYGNAYPGGASPIGIQLFVTYGHASVFSGVTIDILDYTSTNKAKTVRCLNGWNNSTNGEVRIDSGLWSATPAAVTSLTLQCGSSNAYQQYSSFALYGIKG